MLESKGSFLFAKMCLAVLPSMLRGVLLSQKSPTYFLTDLRTVLFSFSGPAHLCPGGLARFLSCSAFSGYVTESIDSVGKAVGPLLFDLPKLPSHYVGFTSLEKEEGETPVLETLHELLLVDVNSSAKLGAMKRPTQMTVSGGSYIMASRCPGDHYVDSANLFKGHIAPYFNLAYLKGEIWPRTRR